MSDRLWLMWGWLDTKRRPAPQLVVKREGTYSASNYNLLLDRDPQRDAGPKDFHLGELLAMLGGHLPNAPGRLLEEGRFSRLCDACRAEHSSPCHLFVRPWPGGWNRRVPFPEGARSLMQRGPGRCWILAELAGMTQGRWERRLYEFYFHHAFHQARDHAHHVLRAAMDGLCAVGKPRDPCDEEWSLSLWRDLLLTLAAPALLPQVVLNLVRSVDVPSGHPDLDFFEGNVTRVAFAFVRDGERHVVEIGGAGRRSSGSSPTHNTRTDRALRRQGWHVHRFSSAEVKKAKDFEEFAWELGFPGRLYTSLRDPSDVGTDDGLQAIDP